MGLGENHALIGFSQETRIWVIACYTAYLASGSSILAIAIKVDTIKRYLHAVAALSRSHGQIDPTRVKSGERAPSIDDILKEAKRWEKVPNRCEPLTKEMLDHILQQAQKERSDGHRDGLYSVISDWGTMGLQSGFRKSEWAQDNGSLRRDKDVQRNVDGTPKAFLSSDFQFKGDAGKHVRSTTQVSMAAAQTVDTCWRFQKNGDNGQKITYAKDDVHKKRCYVTAAKNVVSRAARLKIPPTEPIAQYATYKKGCKKPTIKCVKYITDVEINQVLREAASEVYSIKCPIQLAKFSSHSYRVGACVQLHAANQDAEFIKFRLRWRSDSFKMYLRNIPALARKHLEALNAPVF